MKTRLSTVLLIATFLLAACGTQATPPPPTATPLLPPTAVPPTETPIPTPTNTPFVPKFTFKIVSNSPSGTDVALGAELAVKQLSLPLQELGIQIEYVAYNDQSDIDQALKNAKEIVADSSVLCGVGHYTSHISIAASDVYHLAKLAFISPSSTEPEVTERGYLEISRVIGRDDGLGTAGAAFAQAQGFNKVFVVTTTKGDFAFRAANAFIKESDKLGLSLVGDFEASVEKGNFAAVVEKLTASNADIVYFGGAADQAGPFFKLAREAGYKGAFFGPDSLDDPNLVNLAGPFLTDGSGAYYSAPGASASLYSDAGQFFKDFHNQFGKPPQAYVAEAYDAAAVCLKAIENAVRAKNGEAPTREDVAKAVRAIQDFKGITGTFSFNANGDRVPANYYVFKVATADPAKWGENPLFATYSILPPE